MIRTELLKLPKKLIKKFQSNEIDEILIIGMGTCYTAGVSIATIINNHPVIKQTKIKAKAHLSSELSAFYLSPKMDNILLIGIAQSGTTTDTNVAVKMVKERGAFTLAILNKRHGDISYLVDATLYLGNGRDIEIAVPSTKTYICHILVGYIFTQFLSKIISNNHNGNNSALTPLFDLPNQISNTIENYKSINLDSCLKKFTELVHWYVVYDTAESFTAGMEARIKLSECCYQSIPLLSVDEFLTSNIKNSIAVYIANSSSSYIQNFLNEAKKYDNYIVLIGESQSLDKVTIPKNSITKIKYHQKNIIISTILPTIINCQLLAYDIALKLDSRQHYFLGLLDDIENQEDYRIRLDEVLSMESNDPRITGYQEEKLISLKKNIKEYFISSKKTDLSLVKKGLEYLARYSMRPIDAIKHQAKTITVGTQREKQMSLNKDLTVFSEYQNKFPSITSHLNMQHSNKMDKTQKPTVLLIGKKIDYKLLKFMVDFLNRSRVQFDDLPSFDYTIAEEKRYCANEIILQIHQRRNGNRYSKQIERRNDFFLQGNPETQQLMKQLKQSSNKNANRVIRALLNGLGTCISILRFLLKNSENDQLNLYINMLIEQITLAYEYSDNLEHIARLEKIFHMIENSKNIKFLGSGENYAAAKYLAILSIKKFSKPCAFDVIENHKHIDMSAEPLIINLISNILDDSYQNDAYSEIIKAHSHDNIPIIITNSFDNRFDDTDIYVIKIPCIAREIALLTYVILFKKLLF